METLENEPRLTKLGTLLAHMPRYCIQFQGDVNALYSWIEKIKKELNPQDLSCRPLDLGLMDFEEHFKIHLTMVTNLRPEPTSNPETIVLWLNRIDALVEVYKGFLDSKVKCE